MKGAGKPGGGARRERVAHAIREAVTELIAADVKDPRVRAASIAITRVELNADLAIARCYVAIRVDGDDPAIVDGALAGLVHAARFLRGPVARRIGLARAPELRFFADHSADVGEQLSAIVREDEERARAAGRDPPLPPMAFESPKGKA